MFSDDKILNEIIAANPDKFDQAKKKPSLSGWFVGQVMKETNGQSDLKLIERLIAEKLTEK